MAWEALARPPLADFALTITLEKQTLSLPGTDVFWTPRLSHNDPATWASRTAGAPVSESHVLFRSRD
ncbi:hypothetical protein FDG2_0207 [Candidatus Protofrankia californiensis]|uniref:Uncharacterized protein n=1 Tax=Candidatus Protofrankia californiensis TaxID=1839754 RepID=A0A1C3NT29_9ACTN|nr:hypothetical protein FDG2_0207 [Candidatus Protofrankia californiensis]